MSPVRSPLCVPPKPRPLCVSPVLTGPEWPPPTLCAAPEDHHAGEQLPHPKPPEMKSAGLAVAGRLAQCCPSSQLSLCYDRVHFLVYLR